MAEIIDRVLEDARGSQVLSLRWEHRPPNYAPSTPSQLGAKVSDGLPMPCGKRIAIKQFSCNETSGRNTENLPGELLAMDGNMG